MRRCANSPTRANRIDAKLVDKLVAKSSSDEVWAHARSCSPGIHNAPLRSCMRSWILVEHQRFPPSGALLISPESWPRCRSMQNGVSILGRSAKPSNFGAALSPTLHVGARINPDIAAQLHREALDAQLALAKAVGMNVEPSRHWRFGSLWPATGKLQTVPKE